MAFTDIASRIYVAEANLLESRGCADQYVGIISRLDPDHDDFPTRLLVNQRPEGLSCVIIILESPHIEEFKSEPGPAKGKTGSHIRKWILEVAGMDVYCDYGLILVNAIQNQCSLGFPTKYFRDQVFTAAWQEFGASDFKRRVMKVYRTGDVIVNCCTKGNNTKPELRHLVQKAIKDVLPNCTTLSRTHPYSWFAEKNRLSID